MTEVSYDESGVLSAQVEMITEEELREDIEISKGDLEADSLGDNNLSDAQHVPKGDPQEAVKISRAKALIFSYTPELLNSLRIYS